MERVVSATEARVHFGELMRRVVADNETVIVERGGEPQVIVIAVAEYRRPRAGQRRGEWKTQVQESRNRMRQALGGRPLPPVDEVIRTMREERDERILEAVRECELGDSSGQRPG